ncbi:MAG: hypothetical protein ACYCXF_09040 [Thermoleophilia bacterium]
MTLYSVIFIIALLGALFCFGGFMLSAMESRPQKLWLAGAAISLLVGVAGLVLHR